MDAALTLLCNVGIRIFAYIDDYVLPQESRQFKTPPLWWWVDHLSKIGFRINLNKHSLGQVQVLLIRRALPRLSLTGPFPERHIASFQECLAPFHRGHMVSGWLCHRLLGLMSLFLDIPVRLLQMRDFQRSHPSLCPGHLECRVNVLRLSFSGKRNLSLVWTHRWGRWH